MDIQMRKPGLAITVLLCALCLALGSMAPRLAFADGGDGGTGPDKVGVACLTSQDDGASQGLADLGATLQQVVNAVKSLDTSNLTLEQKVRFASMIASAETAISNLASSAGGSADVDDVVSRVQDDIAKGIADLGIDPEALLRQAIDAAKKLDVSLLTAEQRSALEQAIKQAEQVIEAVDAAKPLDSIDDLVRALEGVKQATETAEKQIKVAEEAAAPAKAPAANPMSVTVKAKKVKAKALAKKAKKVKAITVNDAQGKVVFAKVKVNKKKFAKKFKVNAKTGTITIKKGVGKGTYKITVRIVAAGNARYLPAEKTVKVKVRVK